MLSLSTDLVLSGWKRYACQRIRRSESEKVARVSGFGVASLVLEMLKASDEFTAASLETLCVSMDFVFQCLETSCLSADLVFNFSAHADILETLRLSTALTLGVWKRYTCQRIINALVVRDWKRFAC